MRQFRFIQSGFADAATNMAVDEALFLSFKEGVSPLTLRLYGWRPAAFSLGCSQHTTALLDLGACRSRGLGFVRRPTGGGVLFHAEELTYSVVCASSDINTGRGVKESYYLIASFLIEAYRSLGITARFAKDTRDYFGPAHAIADFCAARKEPYDILVDGKKLGGNAQRRRKNVILQHGSIPIVPPPAYLRGVLRSPAIPYSFDTTSLTEAGGKEITFEQLSEIIAFAFSRHFAAALTENPLSPEEKKLAARLEAEKYSTDVWNLRHENNHPKEIMAQAAV